MSARAAWRLETLGFTQVLRYTAGKEDWLAHALPRGGKSARGPNVGELAARDVPTCGLHYRIGDVRTRLQETGWRVCVVMNEQRVVLGLLWGEALEADSDTPAEEVLDC